MEPEILEAGFIYILMTKRYSLSRSVRAQWLIEHLNKTLTVRKRETLDSCTEELTVVSIVPREPPLEWKPESSHSYTYLVTSHSAIIFLSHKYRIVYCLDMSPSLSSVDIQHGEVMIDEIFQSFKKSIEGFTRPFLIPGSCTLFSPEIYITVIAHTPFFTTPAQQVLVQGWLLTLENVQQFMDIVHNQLNQLEDSFAEVSAIVNEQHDALRTESDNLVGGLFEENEEQPESSTKQIAIVSPDTSFVNMLRYGMLAILLLPETGASNIIVVTDGIVAIPDVQVFDSLLTQLRSCSIACSFLHVGSLFHPHCGLGMVPYVDIMHFIATSTLGVYMTNIPTIMDGHWTMNVYHMAFLTWSFQKGSRGAALHHTPRQGEWHVSNSCFYGCREPVLLRKKQGEDNIPCSLMGILGLRLKEGYTVKNVNATDNYIEISLVLQWRTNIYIEYVVSSMWPPLPASSSMALVSAPSPSPVPFPPPGYVHYSTVIEAPYEFIHDITCLHKKPFKSSYRKNVVSRFWGTLKTISQTDQLLIHLNFFSDNPAAYNIPEGIRSGMPVFYLPSSSSVPVVTSSDLTCPQFAQFWRPVCMLDSTLWQKWFHVHKMALLLSHDHPLPKHLHLANSSGRFQVVQCRQAAAALYARLKDWSTFVLIENHSYVKIVHGENDKPPSRFYLMQVTAKPPCIVLIVAFIEGTPASFRHEVINYLKEKIYFLTFPQRPSNKEPIKRKISMARLPYKMQQQMTSPLPRSYPDINCCVLLQKPIEKILIRYERMPSDFTTVVFPDGTQPPSTPSTPSSSLQTVNVAAGSLLTTLSRYLHHQRWVWAAQSAPASTLGLQAIARVLSTLTKIRLQEGFCFAHSTAGIINMVLEVKMKGCPAGDESTACKNVQPCVIQYVLFPPHTKSVLKESSSDDDGTDDVEADGESDEELEIITECWIEPLYGHVVESPPERYYMENLEYHQIADLICQVDAECISSLLTFEQLSLMCSSAQVQSPVVDLDDAKIETVLHTSHQRYGQNVVTLSEQRILYFPFAFNLMNILPRCQQVEMLLSMFIQDLGECDSEADFHKIESVDAPNMLLIDMMYEHLKNLHDRELYLSPENSIAFMHLLKEREREQAPYELPIPFVLHNIPHDQTTTSQSSASSKKMDSAVSPKWRCFLKGVSITHVMLTFIPASYVDLKLLMMTSESLGGKHPYSVHLVTDQDDMNRSFETGLGDAEMMGSCTNIPLKNSSWQAQGGATPEAEHVHCRPQDKSADLPFRVRASSWDTVMRSNVPLEAQFRADLNRIRTSSMDSKLKHFRPVSTSAKSRGSSVSVTQDAAPNNTNLDDGLPVNEEAPFKGNEMKHGQSIERRYNHKFGALSLPVYIYDCSLSMLMDILIYGEMEPHATKDIYEDGTYSFKLTSKFSKNDNDNSKNTKQSEPKPDSSQGFSGKQSLQQHCEVLNLIHSKCFVFSLFKALHVNQTIYSQDVQAAVNQCEDALVEINITSFLKTVCGHMKDFISRLKVDELKQKSVENSPFHQCASPCTEKDVPASSVTSTEDDAAYSYPISHLYQHGPCQPHYLFHQLIKEKFFRILTVSFQPVPSHPDFYFCAPASDKRPIDLKEALTKKNSDDAAANNPPQTSASQNTDQMEFYSHDSSGTEFLTQALQWDGNFTDKSVNPVFSGVHSESNSEVAEGCSSKEVFPLFLHLTCSVHYKDSVHSCSVNLLPTCLSELLPALEPSSNEINLKKLNITLDIVCLTLPPDVDAVVEASTHKGLRSTSFCSTSSAQYDDDLADLCEKNEHVATLEKVPPANADKLHYLPPLQHKAVTVCVEETEWLMRDEIAAFLLDVVPLQEEMLKFVADHVSASPYRPSCLLEKVPLQFVFDPNQCIEKFIQEFQKLHVSGYLVRQEGQFYYLVKDENCGSRRKRDVLMNPLSLMNLSQPNLDDGMEFWKEIYSSHQFASSDENVNTLSGIFSNADELRNSTFLQEIAYKSLNTTEEADVNDMSPEVSDAFKQKCEDMYAVSADRKSLVLASTGAVSPTPDLFSLTVSPSLSLTTYENQARTAVDDMLEMKRSQSYSMDQKMSPSRLSAVLWQKRHQAFGYRSEVSSIVESAHGTEEDGYEGDSSDSADECDWIHDLESHLPPLPKFWLIMSLDKDAVTLYFHCRLQALQPLLVASYLEVQKTVVSYIRGLCKLVNQTRLLQDLHDTRMCDSLLEAESSEYIWVAGNPVTLSDNNLTGTKVFDDEHLQSTQYSEGVKEFPPGCFACNVIWERQFFLHPRLKSGAGKPNLSRGIQALCTVLNRFSVNNRKNMFVYQDKSNNVYYLRLHEKLRWQNKLTPNSVARSDTDDNSPGQVSRSSSISSLNARRHHLMSAMLSQKSSDELVAQKADVRPRLRSFGDKENSSSPAEAVTPFPLPSPLSVKSDDAIILKVHGISEAGPELKEELVQVLQNRLDDAVLEALSIMLARNPMCKLTPEDVHFIQKPYQPPDCVIQFSIQPWALPYLEAFVYYLRQNLLQFLYFPKYTDPLPENHFQDYSQPEASGKRVAEGNLFLYNQSAASGSKGIACIALAVLGSEGYLLEHTSCQKPNPLAYQQHLSACDFHERTSAELLQSDHLEGKLPSCEYYNDVKPWVEFRIWKQGRINAELLVNKLQTSMQHAMWDLLMEFHWLTIPLFEQKGKKIYETQDTGKAVSPVIVSQVMSEQNSVIVKHAVEFDLLKKWLDFAVQLGVPSVNKFTVCLSARHSLPMIVKEMQNLVSLNAPDTDTSAFLGLASHTPEKFAGVQSFSFRDQQVCMLVGRNINQWRACILDTNNFDVDCLHPKAQKILQKFPPLIEPESNPVQFVPRQRLCLALLTSQQILVYVYNWSKERVDSLVNQTTALGHWLSARTCLLMSISSQKLGIFHNQEMVTKLQLAKSKQCSNPLMLPYLKVDQLIKFNPIGSLQKSSSLHTPVKTSLGGATSNGAALLEVFRDCKSSRSIHRKLSSLNADVIGLNAQQLLETLHQDRKEENKKLRIMWQTRGASPNVPLTEDTIHLFKQHSRIIHYCLTPLLFLPRWRVHSAATRDHSLIPISDFASLQSKVDTKSPQTINSQDKTTPGDTGHDAIVNVDSNKEWHDSLCANFVQEYKQYLQSLGFIPVQSEPAVLKKGQKTPTKQKNLGTISLKENNVCYLQKSLLGGKLLFEIFLCEPFFHARLHALECSRLQTKSSNSLVSQFTASFLDECDKIKILMHMHSFTYDYHLRCIHDYIAEKQPLLKQGYHVTRFVDDFLKYYPKAPNFARNLVYADVISICGLTVQARQLYNYLLGHGKVYGMDVFRMAPVSYDANTAPDNEYVLVRLDSTPHVTYRDLDDTKHTDDFDVTVVVFHETESGDEGRDASVKDDQNLILLKYYIILTSRRELFPKLEVEHKLGKFCTVSTLCTNTTNTTPTKVDPGRSGEENDVEDSFDDSSSSDSTSLSTSDTAVPVSSPPSLNEHAFHSRGQQLHVEIRQESVNYLGYYSSHEQLMQQLILKQAENAKLHIEDMVSKGMVHCRTHLLWNRLQCTLPKKEEAHSKSYKIQALSYSEFMELHSLARVESLSHLDALLTPLLCQPLSWYQSLVKVLVTKYADHHRLFSSPDGNTQYLVVLNPRYLEAFVMLSIDMQTSRGDLSAVYRKSLDNEMQKSDQLEFCSMEIQNLIEGFISACCFHLWAGLL
ncbi:KICSTOR complex protein SZT2-like isoform X2 [Bacillus rossius redtenbacheri]|uniref:KICSTOR complex protein SZT2-like isoform X2 n=1 Tax=Bacillus rossius redtenbacheri TaxID=93214 RepID=UPI002FDEECE3